MTTGSAYASDRPEPWAWSREQWREPVFRVRAGHRFPPGVWPNGARVAVALSFDVDHETPWLRDGEILPGGLSFGEFGSRRGLPRILDLLERHGARASFFVPAVAADLHPGDVRDIRAEGHEIGCHGWVHERPELVTVDQERELLLRSLDLLEDVTGERPVGARTPSFGTSAATLHLMRDAGLRYDSSLMADDLPYEILLDGQPSGLVEVPVDWARDDAAFLVTDRYGGLRQIPDPRLVVDSWLDDFQAASEEGGMFQLTLHPDLIGRRMAFRAFTYLVDAVAQHPSVWFATHAEIADVVHERRGHA